MLRQCDIITVKAATRTFVILVVAIVAGMICSGEAWRMPSEIIVHRVGSRVTRSSCHPRHPGLCCRPLETSDQPVRRTTAHSARAIELRYGLELRASAACG
jgi:hypothetical protein